MTRPARGAKRGAMDPVLRIATVTLLCWLSLGVMRHPHPWRWRLCFVLLAVSVAGFVVLNSTGPLLVPQGPLRLLAVFLAKTVVLFAWWLVQASFSDRFRFDAFRLGVGALWLGLVLLSMWRMATDREWPLFAHTNSVLLIAMMGHLIWVLLSERDDDLRVRRRRVRLLLPAAIIVLLLIDVGVDVILGFDWYPPGFLHAQNAAIFLLTGALAVWTGRVDMNVFAPTPAATAPATSRTSPHAQRIEAMMRDDQLYLDPDLRLSDIVARLPLSEAATRKLIHAEFGCDHFRTFLNRYRIAHALELLDDPARADDKLIAVALDSGFASLASFQRAFRRETGQTPTQWRAAHTSA